ncbi:imm11 family protein [Paenibacillus sp. TSA_86.1]|uniref:imm11 family protein n=1 Tax=Paenibacillus sp. TSA_86.1 TaxID=3415649 RepID=UPI004045203F
MKVYELRNDDSCMEINYIDRKHELGSDFNGDIKGEIWTPTKVKTVSKKKYNDFPRLFPGVPIIKKYIKEVFEPYITNDVEFLPLFHDDFELYVLNITNVLDCVDWTRSDVRTYSDGEWADFNKLVFDFSKIPDDTYMFKIKETATVQVFVTDLFKSVVDEHKFKGLNFSVVYDSEFTQEKEEEQQRLYDAALEEIERNKGQEYSYEEARELVDQGEAMASGPWKMQLNKHGQFVQGELMKDLSYQWMIPAYIPPMLLLQSWHKVKKLEI